MHHSELNPHEYEYKRGSNKLFKKGGLFPPTEDLPRLAKYKRGKKLLDGDHWELFNRAQSLLKNTPHDDRISTLYMACNLVDIVVTKPSDIMYQETPAYESGKEPDSVEQERLNSIVIGNDLNMLGQEVVLGAGYRGDSFIKTHFGYREDFSELPYIPDGVSMEAIIDAQDPSTVFPELSRGSKKKFKAINIAYVEWEIDAKGDEVPYLQVERHTAGFIEYDRFLLNIEGKVNNEYGVAITQYEIEKRVSTGREADVIETGVPRMLVDHIPYKTIDEDWKGIGTAEKIEDLVASVNDRLAQIDYILFKHSDPTAYGAPLNGEAQLQLGGRYIPIEKGEQVPQFMTWDGKLEGGFRELEMLINMIFQIAETPQWLFGTTLGNAGGTGTSHSDGASIKARFMPILTKVKRIRSHVDKAKRNALYNAMLLDNEGNKGVDGFTPYEAPYPKILWRDGIPTDPKVEAEVMNIRTGGKATLDQRTAIKKADGLDDQQAQEILDRIEDEQDKEDKRNALATPDVFNEEAPELSEPDVMDE